MVWVQPWALATLAPEERPRARRALATLTRSGSAATVELTGFEVEGAASGLPAVAHWTSWVDYWLIDTDPDGGVFRARQRVTRAPKQPLPTKVQIEARGRVLVRVVDVLGEEATVELSG